MNTKEKKQIENQVLKGERALFQGNNLRVINTVFEEGESPLKEASQIELQGSVFKWKYPLWYCSDVNVSNSTWMEMGRAGVWYTNRISVENSVIEAPKNFRRCNDIELKNVLMSNAAETLWSCKNIRLENINVKGDYFAMNSENLSVDGLSLVGGYSFDGVKNAEVRNAHMVTKDAFWNSENVTVYDSFISSEYLGWNSKNLTFINCTIESLQGMCYIENLVMKDCTLMNTDLAFEYSTVDVDVRGSIDSIKNPYGGIIRADSIGEIIMEEDKVDAGQTRIICRSEAEDLAEVV